MDKADFNKKALEKIYPLMRRQCILTAEREPVDWHHCLRRCGGRREYGSPLNAIPIARKIHNFAPLHDRGLVLFFLERAEKAVMDAVRRGDYKLTDNDKNFMLLREDWFLSHFPT